MNKEDQILQILEKLAGDVSELKDSVSGLEGRVSGLEGAVSGLENAVSGLRADVDLLKEDQADMRETLTRVAITQENIVLPRLAALAEGHDAILAVCAPKERTERRLDSLESDLSVVKDVVRTHSGRLAELEKRAQ